MYLFVYFFIHAELYSVHVVGHSLYSVMEVIKHVELIVEWFLWTIKHTNSSLDNLKQRFAHHGLRQTYNTAKEKVATYKLVQRAMIGQG